MLKLEELETILTLEDILRDEPMKNHTTFGVGGFADYFVYPQNVEQLQQLVKLCKCQQVDYFILGHGSNLLVSDDGYRGVIISLTKHFNQISVEKNRIFAGAGAMLPAVSRAAWQYSLTGLEFAAGIPGTVGGAVRMNAGAYGGEMKQVLVKVTVLTKDGEIKELSVGELDLSYRHSCLVSDGSIVLGAEMVLEFGEKDTIGEQMRYYNEQRRLKQPLDKGSAGSTFKRPTGYFAGKLIQDAGLRGYTIGGASVSEKHCGFVVNLGNATAAEIFQLCKYIQKTVRAQFGVELELEVVCLGTFE
ncbi:MAG: UDP-N-acetylmuramate dehydrogenase [Lachnospiraceae bacterium]